MKIKYDIVGVPSKLEQATVDIGERFRILYADGVVFEFFDINSMTAWDYEELDGEQVQVEGTDVTTYSKLTSYEDIIVDDEIVGSTPIYTDYTAEFESVIEALDLIVANQPTDDPNPNLTDAERIDRLELLLLQIEGVINE